MHELINHEQVAVWINHIQYLSHEIGPRAPTSPQEKEASKYCSKVLKTLDLDPKTEAFRSAVSIFHPHLMASTVMLLAFFIYPISGQVSAAIAASLSFISLLSQLMELSFRDNIYRRLAPKGDSQNIFATLPPKEKHKRDLVLIGHVDTQRAALVFSTPQWVKVYQAFTTAAFVLSLVQILLFAIGTITQWSWIWLAAIPSAIAALLLAALCIQAERSPFTPGANDNATAVGLVLTLAEELKKEPLQKTRVWFVCTGCEEVQHYGAIDFFDKHRDELLDPAAVVFEMLGCEGPAWLTKEGIIVPFRADPDLIELADQIAEEHPEIGAYPTQMNGGNTEMADALRAGVPAITINGMGPKGEIPYWHQMQDTYEKMDLKVLGRAYEFTWNYLQALDRNS